MREVNQALVGERTKLANERQHLEQELATERGHNEQCRHQIQDIIAQVRQPDGGGGIVWCNCAYMTMLTHII